jgi:hypothetical protein
MDRRLRWAEHKAKLLKATGFLRKPFQAAVYEMSFTSDAEVVTYAYAQTNDHLPDLESPRTFNEKVRWQFLNHANPLMSLAADKIAVRSYLAQKGAVISAPQLLAFGNGSDDLAATTLPEAFVLKSSYGTDQNHIEVAGARTPRPVLSRLVQKWMKFDMWRCTGEFHYRDVPKRWLAEELVSPLEGQLEYKIFCMMGEPVFILVVKERKDKKDYKRNIYDTNWKPVDFHWRNNPPHDDPVPRPALLEAMLADARRLSEDFLHVRVDFFQAGERVVFSELTFASAAARVPFTPYAKNLELGEMIDLSRAPEYLARGSMLAKQLDWRRCSGV